jgi:hypothetical protein
MLLKWVRCSVADRAAFDEGQRGWSALATEPGFLGQFGGWNGSVEAHVFGLWADTSSYQTFMAERHDTIAAGQAGSYSDIEVTMFDTIGDGDDAMAMIEQRVQDLEFRFEPAWTVNPPSE